MAPGELLVDYWRKLDRRFNLQADFIDHLCTVTLVDRNIRNKIESLGEYADEDFDEDEDFDSDELFDDALF